MDANDKLARLAEEDSTAPEILTRERERDIDEVLEELEDGEVEDLAP